MHCAVAPLPAGTAAAVLVAVGDGRATEFVVARATDRGSAAPKAAGRLSSRPFRSTLHRFYRHLDNLRSVACHNAGMAIENMSEVRAWGRHNGLKVSDRGRLPASLLDAYRESIGAEKAPLTPPTSDKPARRSSTKKSPPSGGRKATAQVAENQDTAALTDHPNLFGDEQSVLRRLTSLEQQVAELGSKLETAARALDPSHSNQR